MNQKSFWGCIDFTKHALVCERGGERRGERERGREGGREREREREAECKGPHTQASLCTPLYQTVRWIYHLPFPAQIP